MSAVNIIKEIKQKLVSGDSPEKVIDFIDGVLITLKEQETSFPTPSSPSVDPLLPAQRPNKNPYDPFNWPSPLPPGCDILHQQSGINQSPPPAKWNKSPSTPDIVLCKADT